MFTAWPKTESSSVCFLLQCPLNWRCHPTNSSSVVTFSSCLQSFPALWSFQMSQIFSVLFQFSYICCQSRYHASALTTLKPSSIYTWHVHRSFAFVFPFCVLWSSFLFFFFSYVAKEEVQLVKSLLTVSWLSHDSENSAP